MKSYKCLANHTSNVYLTQVLNRNYTFQEKDIGKNGSIL